MSKNVYIDKLDDIINKYNITYHSTIKSKFVNVKQSTHINFSIENYVKNPRFKVGGYKSILKYKLFLQMLYSKFVWRTFFHQKNWTTLYCGHMLLMISIMKKFLERLLKRMENANQKEFRVKKVIKRKSDKLYVKWKGYNNLFNSWID